MRYRENVWPARGASDRPFLVQLIASIWRSIDRGYSTTHGPGIQPSTKGPDRALMAHRLRPCDLQSPRASAVARGLNFHMYRLPRPDRPRLSPGSVQSTNALRMTALARRMPPGP